MVLKYVQLNWCITDFTYEHISLTSLALLSLLISSCTVEVTIFFSSPFSYLIPVTLNEVPCVALVWPDSCVRVSLSKSSSKQRIRQRWGRCSSGPGAALPGGAAPRVRTGSLFYCTACSPGCCPLRVWLTTTTLEEPVNTQDEHAVCVYSHRFAQIKSLEIVNQSVI